MLSDPGMSKTAVDTVDATLFARAEFDDDDDDDEPAPAPAAAPAVEVRRLERALTISML